MSVGRIRLALCWALVLLGLAVVLGWFAGIEPLKSVVPGLSTMKFNTALCFVVLGSALIAMNHGLSGRLYGMACGALLVGIGVATLAEYALGLDLGIDQLVVRDGGVLTGSGHPGRMSPLTAIAWIALGYGLGIVAMRPKGKPLASAHGLSIVAGFVAFLAASGYTFGHDAFWGIGKYTFTAAHTAAGLAVATVAMLLTRAPEGWMQGLQDAPASRRLLLQLLPVTLILPIAVGMLLLLGSGLGFYNAPFAFALFAPVMALTFAAVVLKVARSARTRELALRSSEERLRTIFTTANDYIVTSDLDLRITSVNPSVCEALGYTEAELLGRPFADFMDAEGIDQSSRMLAQKLAHGGTTRHTLRINPRVGKPLIWDINSQLIRAPDGTPLGLHAIGRDVTEQRRAEEHQKLLVDELNHRVKNTLAIVQGIARQTFRKGGQTQDQLDAFDGRLKAVAAAHGLLTERNWSTVDLREVIQTALRAHLDDMDRIILDGPPVQFPPKAAVTITLALHELATNATKYGALLSEHGAVMIGWSLDDEGVFELAWREMDGPPVIEPGRRGFGSRMLERALATELAGSAAIDYRPDGLVYTLKARLEGVRSAG